MSVVPEPSAAALPPAASAVLQQFLLTAKAVLGADLKSAVLYGSAAEGQLRPTSDVNLLLVLSAFQGAKADALREPLRTAYAAIRLAPMFLLEGEIAPAEQAFPEKFADIRRRRRVLFGDDPFASLDLPRGAEVARLRQVLLNLVLRLRQRYVLRSLREEQVLVLIADTAGPLRTSAATLLELQGRPAASPKEALARIAATLPGLGWGEALETLSAAREKRPVASGAAAPALLKLIDLASELRAQAEALS